MTASHCFVFTFLLGCGASTSPGAHPHAMSAAGHDREAAAHDAASAEHRARYEPGIADPCEPRLATCWNAMRTSNERHGPEADEHARIAGEHRRASAALRDAEARACKNLPDTDRDISPFERTADIARVEQLSDRGADASSVATGIVVTFRLVPGLTRARLERMVECHLTRNAALGHVIPEMPDCPLVPRGAMARVTSVGDALAVEIRGEDKNAIGEIRARGERLVERVRETSP